MVNKLKEVFYDNRWTPENPNGTKPRAGADNMDKYACSSAMVYDGSYFKIKQIQLGYNLPKHLLKKVAINSLRLYVSLDDFFTITKYPGFDPEASANATSVWASTRVLILWQRKSSWVSTWNFRQYKLFIY